MRARLTLGGAAAALAAGAVWLAVASCSIDPSVKEPYRERDLEADEVRTMLVSGDFQRKLEAQKQIDKLDREVKLRVLETLARDADPAVRLIAVKKLKPVDDARAKDILSRLAKDDPDETVRELAAPD